MTAFLDLIPNSRPKRHLDQDAIYEDAYHQCCLMNDILGFDEVAQLFDKDRTRHSCETFFMPRDFRTCLEQARRLTVGSEEYTHVVSSLASSAKTQSLENLSDIMLGGEILTKVQHGQRKFSIGRLTASWNWSLLHTLCSPSLRV